MLRPNALTKLCPEAFSFVTAGGLVIPMPPQSDCFEQKLIYLRRNHQLLGFYIQFKSKTKNEARAYFPSLCNKTCKLNLEAMCPVRALVDISRRGLLRRRFLKSLNKGSRLTKYLKAITGIDQNIAPYALRIGGRTWLIANGMDRQFVDFLGTWKSPEASARYFRAAPREVLKFLRRFYSKHAYPVN